jgi:hypothetical protein
MAEHVAMGQKQTIPWSGREMQPPLVGRPFRPRYSIRPNRKRLMFFNWSRFKVFFFERETEKPASKVRTLNRLILAFDFK